jgi:hypothetical protein
VAGRSDGGWPILAVFARVGSLVFSMPQGLTRHYGQGDLHFVSFSCYHRIPFLKSPQARNACVEILGQVRDRYQFLLLGYAIMPHPPSSRLSASPSFRTEQADFFFPIRFLRMGRLA